MASPEIIEVDSLLQPISEDNPVGVDIREDSSVSSPYYILKDARNSARAAERKSMFDGSSTEAEEHWRTIASTAPEVLTSTSKDLEVATWLTEALLRRNGYQGLRDGFKLIHGLIENFWDNLYPMPDEDGMETRVASLTGLNGEGAEGVLIAPIRNVPLTEAGDPSPYAFWQYQQALEIQKITDEEQRAEKASKIGFSMDDITNAVLNSSDSFYINTVDDLEQCIEEYRAISQLLDQNCGTHEAPPTSNVISVLQDCLGVAKHIGKNKLPVAEEATEAGEAGSASEGPGDATAVARGHVQNRNEAFHQLAEISEFFRKTEPHSPISYILEKAVRWGDMPLADLVKELIPDSTARQFYGSLTGVKTEDEY